MYKKSANLMALNTVLGAAGVVTAVGLMPVTTTLSGGAAVTILFAASGTEVAVGGAQMLDATVGEGDPESPLHKAESLPGVVAYSVDSEYAPLIDAGAQVIPALMTGGPKAAVGWADALEAFGAIKKGRLLNASLSTLTATDAFGDSKAFVTEAEKALSAGSEK